MRSLVVLCLLLAACGPRPNTAGTATPTPSTTIGTTTLLAAKAGPAHIGDSRGGFAVVVPCSETRYVGFSPRNALTARLSATGEGAKSMRVRAQFLDGQGQPLLEQRFDVSPQESALVFALGAGAVVPDRVERAGQAAEFLRLTVESPHCRNVRFVAQVE